ncbi:MAG: peptide deformylase [Thermodesulfovibrionales bacterium]|nr:peptide deformylase [Thermodesulfovibrionales bacterium]
MAILEIRKYPDEVLKKKSLPIKGIDKNLQRLIDDMIETMHTACGIGLAAPQVGVSKRLIVIDISMRHEKQPVIVLINPEIVEADSLVDAEEGCLSLPGHSVAIKRAEKVVVKGLDRGGREIKIEADGLLARALQHEIDHLDGILIFDRLSSIKREFFKKKYLKELKSLGVRS